jgi:hypothetical protein
VLIEQPRATTPHRVPKWFLVAGAVFFGGIAAGIVVLAIHWPFTQNAITKALEEASGRLVQIRTFSNSYFPPGCTAEGIRFLRHKHPEAAPIITVERLTIQGTITGLFSSPKRLSAVRVVGMHMIVPPDTHEGGDNRVALNTGPGGKSLAISQITADGAVLEFIREDRREKPYVLTRRSRNQTGKFATMPEWASNC